MTQRKPFSAHKKAEASLVRSSAAGYLTFVAASGQGGVEAVYADESIWLSQKMMGVLYDVNVRTVNEHLKTIFADSELLPDSVIRKFRITESDGKSYDTQHATAIDRDVTAQATQRFFVSVQNKAALGHPRADGGGGGLQGRGVGPVDTCQAGRIGV